MGHPFFVAVWQGGELWVLRTSVVVGAGCLRASPHICPINHLPSANTIPRRQACLIRRRLLTKGGVASIMVFDGSPAATRRPNMTVRLKNRLEVWMFWFNCLYLYG